MDNEIQYNEEVEDVDERMEIDPEKVHEAIKELPEGSRVIISLYLLENYKHREIAELLGVSESTSKSQYQRARLLLKNKLMKTYMTLI